MLLIKLLPANSALIQKKKYRSISGSIKIIGASVKALSFQVKELALSRREVSRNYWVYGAVDEIERQWWVLIGSGQSPFDHGKFMRRWMYAERNELRQTPNDFFENAYAEQLMHDMRDR